MECPRAYPPPLARSCEFCPVSRGKIIKPEFLTVTDAARRGGYTQNRIMRAVLRNLLYRDTTRKKRHKSRTIPACALIAYTDYTQARHKSQSFTSAQAGIGIETGQIIDTLTGHKTNAGHIALDLLKKDIAREIAHKARGQVYVRLSYAAIGRIAGITRERVRAIAQKNGLGRKK